jgi:prepilin-type N-terminal cleavage/methylation domain-containing protein
MRQACHAFTLIELLVSVSILTLLALIVSRMVNSAALITIVGNRRMDANSQIRPVVTRMTLDFAGMVRRPDVSSFSKGSLNPESGNDQIAFFSNSPGYYPSTGSQSPLSLVCYRINSDSTSPTLNRMERMSKGLLWSGVTGPETPMLFGLQAIVNNWPAATNSSTSDPDYELVGPQIFRFEYYYVLKTGAVSDQLGADGWQDITGVAVGVAAIDQKSRALLSKTQLTELSGRLKDFDPAKPSYDLIESWKEALDGVTDMPRVAINGVRIYQRYFYLTPLK